MLIIYTKYLVVILRWIMILKYKLRDQQKQQSNIIQIIYPFCYNKIPSLILLLIVYKMMLL